MEHAIQLLPDAIANQIAAGEVVQRPSSVVKELLENAVDAGSSRIILRIKDAGKTLIQVSDDGKGMSAQDARMCFERHATSKIRQADDLFHIRTLGFRGEALASIAAVAQVVLQTRLHSEELGTKIEISGSEIKKQEPAAIAPGSSFYVKNLFYNVPARRNFLKTNAVETRHILQEFIRVALPHPELHLQLHHNDQQVYDLPPANLEQRIVDLIDKKLKDQLIPVEESTGYVTIKGYIGKPSWHRKLRGDQFFFVNGRYIRSGYLHHAISTAFEDFIPEKQHPFYCIFLEIDPVHVDINIHPTKTEVKFDDERTIYALLQGCVKRGLGEVHQIPEFDFEGSEVKQAIYNSPASPSQEITVGQMMSKLESSKSKNQNFSPPKDPPVSSRDWDALYQPQTPSTPNKAPSKENLFSRQQAVEASDVFLVQFQDSYILTQRETQLYIIQQNLAHRRILYERFLATTAAEGNSISSQQLLFPQTIELSPADFQFIKEVEPDLSRMGFEVKEFGLNTYIVYGTPPDIPTSKIRDIFEQVLMDVAQTGKTQVHQRLVEKIAMAVAMRSAIKAPQKLSTAEMKKLVEELFKCKQPRISPGGNPTFQLLSAVELEQYFG